MREQEIFITMRYAINSTFSCTGECFVYIFVLETDETNQSLAIRDGTFKPLAPLRNDGGRGSSTLRFPPYASLYSGFYLAFRDFGTCVSMNEVVVFYPICDAVFLELGLNFTKAQMPEGASFGSCFANMALNTTNDYVQAVCILRLDRSFLPTWTIISEDTMGCMCVPGYSFINRTTVDQCKGICVNVYYIIDI